ncbi:MAG: hypothetical protein MZV63_64780 [Marinilabiliales bacterium]|nr:hypothetical protein [Marinilabiliales bacterium]
MAILVFTMLVIFAALLSFILIGIPLALALGAAGFIVKVFGRLAVFYFLGDERPRAPPRRGQRLDDRGRADGPARLQRGRVRARARASSSAS